jgi:hypothetical protein
LDAQNGLTFTGRPARVSSSSHSAMQRQAGAVAPRDRQQRSCKCILLDIG